MERNYRIIALRLIVTVMTVSVFGLTGCGKNIDDAAHSISSGNADTSKADGTTAGSSSAGNAGSSSVAGSELPDNLDEGEVQIGESTEQTGQFAGTLPETDPDWTTILSDKPDAIAVVTIPGTDITNMAVLPEEKNTDSMDQDSSASSTDTAGSQDSNIYIDSGNNTDFTDPVTVLRGCTGAEVYGDSQFLKSNPYIYIYQQNSITQYRVFAACSGNSDDLLTSRNMYDYNEYVSFIDEIYSTRSIGANFDDSMKEAAKSSWQMLVISTGGLNSMNIYCTLTASRNI